MADADQVLLGDRSNPRVFLHLEDGLLAEQIQAGDFRRQHRQPVVLDVQLADARQLADFARQLEQIVVAEAELGGKIDIEILYYL